MQPRNMTDVCVKVYEHKVPKDHETHWGWCRTNLKNGTWYAHYGLMKSGPSTYWFENPEDALAFKLIFWMTTYE